MILFFSVFFTVYAAVNYYIFIRGWQSLAALPHLRIIYLIVFLLVSLSFILSKLLQNYLPAALYSIMQWIGSFWFAYMLYFILFIVFFDILKLLNNYLTYFPSSISINYKQWKFGLFIFVILVTSVIVFTGYINTRIVNIKNLELTLRKGSSPINKLNIVSFADIHLTPMNNEELLSIIIDKANSLNPDIVLIPGDFADEKTEWLETNGIGKSFLRLNPKYGVFASTGNHEFIVGINNIPKFITDHNIRLLRDENILIDGSFYLAARDDYSKKQFTGEERKPLSLILNNRKEDYPVILMDHTPFKLDEAEKNNIDLQLSGHTHHAQLWPLNFLTGLIYEKDWGYLKKGNTQYYITCGVGTWGPPVRTGSKTEIVNIKIKFQ
ncbi:MAG TPA: metallophosphoesterase [Ignavibacteriaceae bacterium]|nr:metallophosphoesterase [Ignavibacteriaceae bacterium]